MNNLFNLLHNTNQDCNFSNEIKQGKYIESINNSLTNNDIFKKHYNNLVFCILDNNDMILSNTPKTEKSHILNQRILEILSIVDSEDFYKNFGYNNRVVKKQEIQTNVQLSLKGKNNILTIKFFNDYYKIHFVIVDFHSKKYYETTKKNYNRNYLVIKDKKFYLFSDYDISKYNLSHLDSLSQFTININKNIYKTHLDSIGKYKINDLKDIAKNININLTDNGKQKTKQILYEEINNYYLNLI